MNIGLESAEQTRELASSSSFYRMIYSEIEEVGWERLVRLSKDLTVLSFRIIDKKGREHIMEIILEKTYPKCPPSVSADVPCILNLKWSTKSRLKDVMQQFQEHLEKLQEFWSILDDIDKSLWVVEPKQPYRAIAFRQINIANDCFLTLFINANDPKSLPESKAKLVEKDLDKKLQKMVFLKLNLLRKIWTRNCKRWMKDKPICENLAIVLETKLPRSPDDEKNEQQTECGICYAQFLPIDDELGTKSGGGTDYTCDNNNCSRAFHSVCLVDWLRSITTTRQSFDVLFGNCPYCSDPVAVKSILK